MALTPVDTAIELPPAATKGLARLRESSERVVGTVFYGTMLKAMRNSGIQGKYGHGGRGEQAFAGQLDAILAERMGAASKGGLTETLYRHLEKQQQRISTQDLVREGI